MSPVSSIVSLLAAAAIASQAGAGVSTVIDSFSAAGALGAQGSGYAGLGEFSTADWTTGSGHLGSRLIYDNSWGDGLVAQSMSGNGQFVASLNGGTGSDTQLIAQYRMGSAIDLSGAGTSILVRGAGAASGGDADNVGYGIGIALFNGAASDGTWTNRCWMQLNMFGAQSLGNFAFSIGDFAAAASAGQSDAENFDFSQVNAFQFYQYAYAGGQWDYVATSFEIVPAPGAMALLGIAGLAGVRRRRA
jgi:uncharacterized protein (TIGR03382 family)